MKQRREVPSAQAPLPEQKAFYKKDVQRLSESEPHVQNVRGGSLLALWGARERDAGPYVCVAESGAGTAHRRHLLRVRGMGAAGLVVGRPPASCTDDLRKVAGGSWVKIVENRDIWRELGEELEEDYVQQWTAID
ncbi:unnamed protein product [Euphydryas editha]|uniref:Uncharacterized protein n=1 Tax=Euphydryas editha TaxID=104508 RepID=A0AAU9UL40_EUPED|nr:unnamed protein product [Euphydryas editha]